MSQTLSSLLASRGASLFGPGGDAVAARERADLSRHFALRYADWDRLRTHLFNPQHHPRIQATAATRELAKELQDRGWIRQMHRDDGLWLLDDASPDVELFLRGGWLEEYVWLAYLEAGCDEIRFGQQVQWTVDGVVGLNEIDVIARRGGQLSFTSCKCLKPMGSTNSERLREFLNEVGYWDWHFADRHARGVLITTADMVDEIANHSPRHPTLMARAKVLDINVTGLEGLEWSRLVRTLQAHWG